MNRLFAIAAAIILALLCAPTSPLQAQREGYIQGLVHDAGDENLATLAGATVKWKGTNVGVVTLADGSFEIIKVEETDTLVISYIGYKTEEVKVTFWNVHVLLEPITQDEVVVTEEESTISSAPQRTENVTSRELRRAACCSLAESFERSPSVEVSYSDAASGARTILLLGLRGQYTQLLTEAVHLMRAVETPFGMEHIPGPFMESINISKGAGTVTNGYDGMVGAINVWLHEPFLTPLFYGNVYANTMSRFEGNFYSGQQVSDVLSTATMLHGRILQEDIDNNGDGFLDVTNMKQLNAVHRWAFNNDEYEWQFLLHGLLDNYASGQHEDSVKSGAAPYLIDTDIERLEGFAKFGLLDVFYDLQQSSLAFVVSGGLHNAASIFGKRTIDARERQFDAKVILTTTLSDLISLNSGLSFRYDNIREDIRFDDSTGRLFDRIERVPGVYAEATITPIDELTLMLGARYDVHNIYGSYLTPRLHVKYDLGSVTFLRASVGRGWRAPAVVSENLSSFVNNRNVYFDETFDAEESWNYGGSFTTTVMVGERPIVFDAEIYRTDFVNKVIIDYDRSVRDVYITNLDGSSYSTSFMAQIQTTPLPRFDVTVAYRWLDVQAPLDGTMQLLPMLSRHRGLLTLAWESSNNKWQVDGTVSYNGTGRLPTTEGNPDQYRRELTFPGYWRVNGQVTYKFDFMDIYVGSENITNFIQQDPIIAAEDPFGQYFDASLAWGPTSPWMMYIGIRFSPFE